MTLFIKYFCAALASLVLDYMVAASALYMNIPYHMAIGMGLAVGAVVGFLLLTYWVFPSAEEAKNQEEGHHTATAHITHSAKQGAFSLRRTGGFILGLGLVYVVRSSVMFFWYSLQWDAKWQYVALIFSYGCSFMLNFTCQKYLVFVSPKSTRNTEQSALKNKRTD